MFSLLKFTDVAHQLLMLLVCPSEHFDAAGDILLLAFLFLFAQFGQFYFVVVVLLAVLLALLGQLSEHVVVHGDLIYLTLQVPQYLPVPLNYVLVWLQILVDAGEEVCIFW